MRKSTKTLIALIGTAVVALGVVVNYTGADEAKAWTGPDGEYYARSNEYYERLHGLVEDNIETIVDQTVEATDQTPEVADQTPEAVQPDSQPSPEEVQQERMTAQAAADRQALIDEGSKLEHYSVVNSNGDQEISKLRGLYLINDIKGISYNPAGEYDVSLYCVAYETNASKSPAAIAAATEVANSVNAIVGPSVNIQYEKYQGGQLVKNSKAAEGTMKMGLDPSFAGEGDKVAVVAVYPGGATKIFDDTDNDPSTVTVDIPATDSSLVMYTLIKYN
jgi:hypothetical protein